MSFAADVIAAGVGIGLVPEVYFPWAHQSGLRSAPIDLVRVLPDHAAAGPDMSLVSPPTTYEPARVGLFRDFLVARLQPLIRSCTLALEEQKRARRAESVEGSATGPAAGPSRRPTEAPVTPATPRRPTRPSRPVPSPRVRGEG